LLKPKEGGGRREEEGRGRWEKNREKEKKRLKN